MADYQSQFTGQQIDQRLAAVTDKQDRLVSGTNIKTVGGQSILGSGDIPIQAGDPNAVKYVAQTLTDAQKTQARTNIGAAAASALSALETAIAAKYSKPSGGIPETDLASAVQSALALARTSIQSLADYYSKTEVDALLDAVGSEQYVDVTTLPTASASTLGKIYLVGPDANGFYNRYYTSYDGSTYSWVAAGNTEINLANYATKAEISQLQQKVDGTISPARNIFLVSGFDGVTGLTRTGNEVTGKASAFHTAFGGYKYIDSYTGPFKTNTRYTVSYDGYTDAEESTTGIGLQVRVLYSDNTVVGLFGFNNNRTQNTHGQGTTDAGKTVVGIGFSYGSAGGNTWHISNIQIEEGTEETSYTGPYTDIGPEDVKGWILAESYTATSVVRSVDGVVSSAVVVWPDGTNGTLTITRDADGNATQCVAVYGNATYTLSITRNADGFVTATSIV